MDFSLTFLHFYFYEPQYYFKWISKCYNFFYQNIIATLKFLEFPDM